MREKKTVKKLGAGKNKKTPSATRKNKIQTSLKKVKMPAAETIRVKTEFLAKMSHELRTPLNAIIGFSELICDEKVGGINAEQREYLGDIVVSAKHLLQLINDVLDISRIQSGKLEFRPEKVNLEKLIREVQDKLQAIKEKKRINISTEFDKSSSTVVIDPSRFKQIIHNYLSNALKFTPEYGTIQIRIKAEKNNRFRLEIADNGIGIQAEDLKKIFIEFTQLDGKVTKEYPGNGLGLSLTKHIVEAQGGNVGVESILGKGSLFYAVLPTDTASQRLKKKKKKA